MIEMLNNLWLCYCIAYRYFIFHPSVILKFQRFTIIVTCVNYTIRSSSFIKSFIQAYEGFSPWLLPFPSLYSFSLIHWHSLCKGRSTSCSSLFVCSQTLIWLWTIVNILPELHLQFAVWFIPEALPTRCVSNLYLPGRVAPSESSNSTMKVRNKQQ